MGGGRTHNSTKDRHASEPPTAMSTNKTWQNTLQKGWHVNFHATAAATLPYTNYMVCNCRSMADLKPTLRESCVGEIGRLIFLQRTLYDINKNVVRLRAVVRGSKTSQRWRVDGPGGLKWQERYKRGWVRTWEGKRLSCDLQDFILTGQSGVMERSYC